MAWVLVITMTASFQKVFSGDPKVGYFAQRAQYADALARGEVLAPATDEAAMAQVVTNSTRQRVLQSVFAVLALLVGPTPRWSGVRAIRAGGLPTTEAPAEPSRIVEPSGFFPTAAERELLDAERARLAAEREPSGSSDRPLVVGAAWYLRALTGEDRYDRTSRPAPPRAASR